MRGTPISSSSDFPHTAVFERAGPNGNVYTIAFDNREFVEGWRTVPMAAWFVVLIFSVIPVAMMLPDNMLHWWAVIWVIAFAASFFYFKQPWKVKRTIELDFGTDQLRVLRNGKVENSRQLTSLANLTVDEHPNAEVSRIDRMAHGEKKPKMYEKQHCLFGWFGAGGAEQVMLVNRAEWPNHQSLFEVRQAIMWAIEQAPSRNASAPASPQTIKPPLD